MRLLDQTGVVKNKIDWKKFAPAFVLVVNSLLWYTLTFSVFTGLINDLKLEHTTETLLFGTYYASTAISAIVGGWLFPRARKTGILLWMVFGAIMSVALITIPMNNLFVNFIISILLGLSIGSGLPSTLAYFADVTNISRRGFLGGLTWSSFGFGSLILFVLVSAIGNSAGLELLAIWRVTGIILVFVLIPKQKLENEPKKQVEGYKKILTRRENLFYLLPWIMFSLINFAETPILQGVLEDPAFVGFVELAITGIFALIGGILADRVGRKRIVITGFVLLGIEYAALSIDPTNSIAQYIYMAFDGAAWGMFAAVFFMTLWGDLSEDRVREKYYVLGGLPFLLSGFITMLVEPIVIGNVQDYASSAFSIASFFLFVAVLPLVYAPETLPEKTMKDRDLKSYIEKARKIANKNQKQENDTENSNETESTQESAEERKARELAEKYY